jgi:hypothetical protein
VLPAKFDRSQIPWARERAQLWNAAEHAETRRNSRIAREYQLSLPHELNGAQRIALATAFSSAIAERYGVAVDMAVHLPGPGGDPRNHHVHLLTSTREVLQQGFGRKVGLELRDAHRRRQGLLPNREEYKFLRRQFADLTNEALRAAQLEVRVDARTLAEQGIDRVPRHLPWHLHKSAQRALQAGLAERVRDQYRARSSEPVSPQPGAGAAETRQGSHASKPPSLEEIQREARRAWLEQRAASERGEPLLASATATVAATAGARKLEPLSEATRSSGGKGRDDDLAL